MQAGILILAAGSSRRFGSDKRRALLNDNVSVLNTLLATLKQTQLPLQVCLGPDDSALSEELALRGFSVITCTHAREGMGATLAHGITAVAEWPATLVALADMPWIQADTFRAVARHCAEDRIVAPRCRGRQGHPVGFGRDFYPLLRALEGDKGGRDILRSNSHQIHYLNVNDSAIHHDIDTPVDLVRGGYEH